MSSLIQLTKLSKIYQTAETALKALDNIDLIINSQDLLAIVGASGSGKSTMMNILGLLDRPTVGEFLLNGENVAALSDNDLADLRNKTIGFVFQQFFLLPRLNAVQNISLPLLYRGLGIAEARKRADAILEKVGISHLAVKKPNQMSGGEQQRVAIARALVGNPDILLADEPTGSLDSKTGQEIIDLFIELNRVEKRTVIIITHDPNISKQCKRVVSLKDGEIISDVSNNVEMG